MKPWKVRAAEALKEVRDYERTTGRKAPKLLRNGVLGDARRTASAQAKDAALALVAAIATGADASAVAARAAEIWDSLAPKTRDALKRKLEQE